MVGQCFICWKDLPGLDFETISGEDVTFLAKTGFNPWKSPEIDMSPLNTYCRIKFWPLPTNEEKENWVQGWTNEEHERIICPKCLAAVRTIIKSKERSKKETEGKKGTATYFLSLMNRVFVKKK
jgi:hypothetical protein